MFSRHGLPGTHDPVPTHEELVPSFVEEIVASPEFAEPSILSLSVGPALHGSGLHGAQADRLEQSGDARP